MGLVSLEHIFLDVDVGRCANFSSVIAHVPHMCSVTFAAALPDMTCINQQCNLCLPALIAYSIYFCECVFVCAEVVQDEWQIHVSFTKVGRRF
jgi:hypothetical protein